MILVTGGLGVMGARLVQGLAARGFPVRVLDSDDRFRSRLDGIAADIRIGDITRPDTLAGCFDGVDTVYHLAAVVISRDPARYERINVGGTRNVLAAATAAGVRHFILVSSASVTYAHPTPYGLSKREAERLTREQAAMRWTIVRPTLAYNEHGGEEFNMFLAYLRRFPVVPFIGSGKALKRPVHCDDLMEGFLAIAGNGKSHGKTYAFSGGEAVTVRDMARLMLRHVGGGKPFLHLPISVCLAIAFVAERFQKNPLLTWTAIAGVIQDANLDHTEARRDLGFRPLTFREGLQRSYPLS
jgi:nucleoside-diphosphate-sugar epimerase